MKTLTQRTLLAMGFPLLWSVTAGFAQLPATPEHAKIMERKLTCAQQVLAGVAREDFDEIKKNAQMLTLLSHEAGWNVLLTPEYMRLSDTFRKTTQQLETAADDRNLDAAGLAFVKLSISCIDCHRHAKQELSRIGRQQSPSAPTVSLQR